MIQLTDEEIVSRFKLNSKDKIVDIGGSMRQHNNFNIDTLVDIIRPEEAPYGPSPLRAKNFVKCDFTKQKLPFADNQFDFCLCTHTIEDLSNPFLLLNEMSRIAKHGYITTPSMGKDMVFSHLDYTNWLTGARRVPGDGHHKWFVISQKDGITLIPKNYPVLYSSHFNFVDWSGDPEMQYYWEKQINYKEINDLNIHKLIDFYQNYVNKNKKKLKKSLAVIFLDSPFYIVKAFVKLILRRGKGFGYRQT